MGTPDVELREIRNDDGPAVAEYLHTRLNHRVPPEAWLTLVTPPWPVVAANHGFQLVAEQSIVGAYVAVHSRRNVNGVERTICNLAAFCVDPEYRPQALRLLRRVLGQRGVEFTDLSPSGNVVGLNERLGFKFLDTSTRLVPNLPWAGRRGLHVTGDPSVIAHRLLGRDREIYADHSAAPAARHVIAYSGHSYAYLMFRRDRRKRAPLFASPLFVSGDRELLVRAWPQLGSHLLLRHGLPFTLAERRVLGFTPRVGLDLQRPRPKMFRSDQLSAGDIDYLYSELVLLEW